jgi:Integrase core domain
VARTVADPQSNGKLERWYRSPKSECIRTATPLSQQDAERLIQQYVDHYNRVLLHSAIGYATPMDMLGRILCEEKNARHLVGIPPRLMLGGSGGSETGGRSSRRRSKGRLTATHEQRAFQSASFSELVGRRLLRHLRHQFQEDLAFGHSSVGAHDRRSWRVDQTVNRDDSPPVVQESHLRVRQSEAKGAPINGLEPGRPKNVVSRAGLEPILGIDNI